MNLRWSRCFVWWGPRGKLTKLDRLATGQCEGPKRAPRGTSLPYVWLFGFHPPWKLGPSGSLHTNTFCQQLYAQEIFLEIKKIEPHCKGFAVILYPMQVVQPIFVPYWTRNAPMTWTMCLCLNFRKACQCPKWGNWPMKSKHVHWLSRQMRVELSRVADVWMTFVQTSGWHFAVLSLESVVQE